MAISYPINTPATIGIESINIRAANAVGTSQSPFTYKQQVVVHQGQRWEASITIPSTRRDLASAWKAFLVSLRGGVGTFLLSDPDYATPRGNVSSCTLSGSIGDESPTVTMTGSLLTGDYIQLGSGGDSKLHMVLQDKTGSGTLEIWPGLRSTYTDETVIFNDAKGVFRLASNTSEWAINNSSAYGISFDAVEKIT